MKQVYVNNKTLWYGALIIGILLVIIGIVQMGLGMNTISHKTDKKTTVLKTALTNENNGANTQNDLTAAEQKNKPQLNISKDTKDDFFTEYRLERDRTRSQQIDLFREIVNNQNSVEESRKEAQRKLLALNQAMETEMKLENMIKAENIKDCVALVEEKSATIIVQVPMLTAPDKIKINQITTRITGLSQENIFIIPKA